MMFHNNTVFPNVYVTKNMVTTYITTKLTTTIEQQQNKHDRDDDDDEDLNNTHYNTDIAPYCLSFLIITNNTKM